MKNVQHKIHLLVIILISFNISCRTLSNLEKANKIDTEKGLTTVATGEKARLFLSPLQKSKLESLEKLSTKPVRLVVNKKTGTILFLELNLPVQTGSNPQMASSKFINEYIDLFDPKILPGELASYENPSSCPEVSATFQRTIGKTPVIGSTISVLFSKSGAITSIENSLASVTSKIVKAKFVKNNELHPLISLLKPYSKLSIDSLAQNSVLIPVDDKEGGHLENAVLIFYPNAKNQSSAILYNPITNKLISDSWLINPGGTLMDDTASVPALAPKFHLDKKTGIPDFITYRPIGGLQIPTMNSVVNPIQTVYTYLEQWPAVFRTGSPHCQFSVNEITQLNYVQRTTFVRMQQMYVGLPVFGAQLVFEIKDINKVMSVMGHTLSNIYLNPVPKITAGKAIENARQQLILEYKELGVKTNEWEKFGAKTELCVFPGELTGRDKLNTHLAYKVEENDFYVFIDAHDGKHIYTIPRRSADAPGLNFIVNDGASANEYSRPFYTEISRNGIPTGSVGTADATSAATFVPMVGGVYSTYSRSGLDGNNLDYIANTNVAISTGCANAFFTDLINEVFICNGTATNDVIGHEFTHGIISHSSGLVYQDESGALNESYADIMGNLIFPDVATLAPGVPAWVVGEAVAGGSFRDMANPTIPTLGQYRARNIGSNTCNLTASSCDNGFVHTNSGITNLAHVLLADGNSIPATAIAIGGVRPGIGRIKVRELAFLTMTQRLTPWSRLVDSELGTHENAEMLQSLGALPIRLSGEIPPGAFNQLDADLVPSFFGQVGLTPDLESGFASPQIGFTGTQTFFPGETTDNSCNVTNVRIKVLTPSGDQITEMVPPSTVNYFGVFGATSIPPGPIGTSTKTNIVTWFNIFGGSPTMYCNIVANPPAGDDDCRAGLNLTVQRTSPVQDKLVPGMGLWSDVVGPTNSIMNTTCALINTEVEIVDGNNNVLEGPGTTVAWDNGHQECFLGQCGWVTTVWRNASVATPPPGLPDLSTRINWSAVGTTSLRYRVRYFISQPPGINCQP